MEESLGRGFYKYWSWKVMVSMGVSGNVYTQRPLSNGPEMAIGDAWHGGCGKSIIDTPLDPSIGTVYPKANIYTKHFVRP